MTQNLINSTDKFSLNSVNSTNHKHLDLYELKKYSVEDKEIIVNENFSKISAYLCGGVISKQINDPSLLAHRQNGAKYLIPNDARGEWAGKKPGTLALSIEGSWHYIAPQDGELFWVLDEAALHVFAKGIWNKIGAI